LDVLADEIKYLSFNLIEAQKQDLEKIGRNLSYFTQKKLYKNAQQLIRLNNRQQQSVKGKLNKAHFRLSKFQFLLEHDLKIKLHQMDVFLDQSFKKVIKESRAFLLSENKNRDIIEKNIEVQSYKYLKFNKHKLIQFEHLLTLADPKKLLRKGFSISRINGKLLRSINEIEINSIISTELCDGILESKIINSNKHEQETDL